MSGKQKITPCLWFDGNAEEAVAFYTSVFEGSKVLHVARYGDGGPGPKGAVMTVVFELAGQRFMALNGGPRYKFSEAISLMVDCETQAEVDELWAKLGAGGQEIQCGWLKDSYGLAWQIVPSVLGIMMSNASPEQSTRLMRAIQGMVKPDIAGLQRAYEGH
jgi:predicted 3-demethylubiquinone-9 3-methyltransferase (glyoxalase superfamily)